MTSRSPHPLGRSLALWLVALTLWAGAVVPILDAGDWSHGASIESGHDPRTCVRGHDHTICTQVLANAGLAGVRIRPLALHPALRHAPPAAVAAAPDARAHSLPFGPRAPPLA